MCVPRARDGRDKWVSRYFPIVIIFRQGISLGPLHIIVIGSSFLKNKKEEGGRSLLTVRTLVPFERV